ncbi:MAG: HNH endonuclease signature motif containing protein [Chloroflexi bacterium]|nr:HNH endonuclease signature motif containing protein [Chloroflexota bacterium]
MSLRKVSSGRIEKSGFWIFSNWRFYTSKSQHFSLTDSEHRRVAREVEATGAARIGEDGDRVLWWTDGGLFWADADLSSDDVELLVWDRQRRQDARLDRLRKIRARDEDIAEARRERIRDAVRAFVWERDAGQCTQCGVEDDLQFDHVIPVAKGGGNTIDNIQILCGDCNRQKSDSIV